MKLVYEAKKLIGSFVKGRFVEVPPIAKMYDDANKEMMHIHHLVLNHNHKRYEEFNTHYRQMNLRRNRMQEIIAESATKAMLHIQPEMPTPRKYRFEILEESPVSFFSPDGTEMQFNSFELDLNILAQMAKVAIRKVMEEDYLPYPKTMVIGRCLSAAVKCGKLPKRMKINVMNMNIIYDSGIDGIVFI